MATDPRAALDRLVSAFEVHLAAAARRRGDADPAVEAAYDALSDAFEAYDEALYAAYDEVTPLVVDDEEDDDLEDPAEGDVLGEDDLDDLDEAVPAAAGGAGDAVDVRDRADGGVVRGAQR